MDISPLQAALIGLVYYLGFIGTPWFTCQGSFIFNRPLVGGLLVGLILGDPVQGAIIGAAVQLPFIAFISAGGSNPTDPGLAGTLGVALAMSAGADPATAIVIATPIGLFGTIIWVLHMTIDVAFLHRCDMAAERGDMRALGFWQIIAPQFPVLLLGALPVALGCYFGSNVVSDIIDALQGRPLETLQVIGGVLPAIGIAMNLRALDRPGILLWFILGFIIAVYSGIGTLPLAIAAAIVAYFVTGNVHGSNDSGVPGTSMPVLQAANDPNVASDDSDLDFE